MAGAKKPSTANKRVFQDINLKEALGVSLRGRAALKEAVAQQLIDIIQKRAESGKGVSFSPSGRSQEVSLRRPYSKKYAETDEFKAAGKSRGRVNMSLKGDMLGLMDVVQIKGNTVRIGWNDREEELKAHGHMTGQEGKNPKMQRPFFGVTNSDLRKVKKEFAGELREALKAEPSSREALIANFLLKLTENSEDSEE